MKTSQTLAAGVDIIGNRYYLCLLDSDGKHPRYYRGRVDTPFAQNKLIAYLNPDYRVVIVESSLSLVLLSFLPSERVVIKEEGEHYRVWQKAGIERGNEMARFAALLLYDELVGPKPLSEKEKRELMASEWERTTADVERIERARKIISEIQSGKESSTHYSEALRLVQQAEERPRPLAIEEPEYTIDPGDNSFLAKVARAFAKKR